VKEIVTNDRDWDHYKGKPCSESIVPTQEPTRLVVNVPKLLNWVKEDTGRPGQQTQKEKLRKLLGAR
jgi:hypothetical protein